MNGYELSRNYFDWCFENPEKVSPNHTAIYFFAIEHCNRLGWRKKFGFPTQMAMDAIGIKKHQTYSRYLNDLVDFGFIQMIEKSRNQYSSNIISLINAMPKNGKALDKAIVKHGAKQTETMGQSTGQSNSSIYKQLTINQEPIKPLNKNDLIFQELIISESWIENTAMQSNLKFTPDEVKLNLKKYNEMLNVQFDIKSNKTEYCTHFVNWLNKQQKQKNVNPTQKRVIS
jgi:hypothetical protein